MLGIASCEAAEQLIETALEADWTVSSELITCPVRIVWGPPDELLPWPSAAARYRRIYPRPIGSSSTGSAIAASSTSPWKPRS